MFCSNTEASIVVHDKVTNEEYWMILKGNKKELKYPRSLLPGHEYYVKLHVTEAHTQDGVRFKHKICQPILKKSFRLGKLCKLCQHHIILTIGGTHTDLSHLISRCLEKDNSADLCINLRIFDLLTFPVHVGRDI